VQDYYDV
jgi:hypothetical protein